MTIFLKAGLILVHRSHKNEQGITKTYNNSEDITENGAILATYRYDKTRHTLSYMARAVNAGKFYTPPAKTELMYEPQINAVTRTEVVEIMSLDDKVKGMTDVVDDYEQQSQLDAPMEATKVGLIGLFRKLINIVY